VSILGDRESRSGARGPNCVIEQGLNVPARENGMRSTTDSRQDRPEKPSFRGGGLGEGRQAAGRLLSATNFAWAVWLPFAVAAVQMGRLNCVSRASPISRTGREMFWNLLGFVVLDDLTIDLFLPVLIKPCSRLS
jgi:hypothetical protein